MNNTHNYTDEKGQNWNLDHRSINMINNLRELRGESHLVPDENGTLTFEDKEKDEV